MKKIILYILIIFWMGLIFYFSNQPSIKSTSVSDGVMSKIINIVEIFTNHEFSEIEVNNIYEYGITPLRKCAHLSIYFVLGILFYLLIKQYGLEMNKTLVISLLFCIIYACSDEIHQLFIFGRSGEIKDVLIDTIGSFLGIILISKIINRKNDKKCLKEL